MQKDVTLRYCDGCHHPLPINGEGEQEGYYADGEYYCSLDHMHISEVEWSKLYSDDGGEYYYTTWPIEESEQPSTYYVVVGGEDAHSCGLFLTEQRAQDEVKRLHKNGYFGELTVTEEEVTA